MGKKLKDNVVIVTGATAGIGLATVRLFKEQGAAVICLARHASEEFEGVQCDITDPAAVKAAVRYVQDKYGRIDVLVNNAGMGISGAIEDTTDCAARSIFDVNFFGALNLIRETVPLMRTNGGGTIINVSSVAAGLSIPFQAFYSATKAAVSSLSKALRSEVAPFGIKVTAILPGDVKTDFTSSRRKNDADNPAYGKRITRSVAVMERDEQNGMPPSAVARAILRTAKSKRPPVEKVIGFKYKLFVLLAKILPLRLVNYIVAKIYA